MLYKLSGIFVTGIGISVLQRELSKHDVMDGSMAHTLYRVTRHWTSGFPSVFAEDNKLKVKGQVVLVTGGAGFLGQHIVKQLQERAEFVGEIRVLDLQPYKNTLGHEEKKPVKSITADIRHLGHLREAVKGVDAVIHTAGVVSYGLFPNLDEMETVNVIGTENVVEACISENVPHLVFTSATDVVIGYDDIVNGDESLPAQSCFLFNGFPETKAKAEKIVMDAHGKKLANGKGTLSTLSLRPNVMYGEGDLNNVPNALRSAKKRKGKLPVIGKATALFQQAYVGNMAWAHVVALHALRRDDTAAASSGGQAYFLTDDTPVLNTYAFMAHFLDVCGFGLAAHKSSYRLLYPLVFLAERFLLLMAPLYELNSQTTLSSLTYMNRTYVFSRDKAAARLGYRPLYTWSESFVMSADYYMGLQL